MVKIIISYHKNDEILNDIYILSHHFNVDILIKNDNSTLK